MNKIDERFLPRKMEMSFTASLRHFKRYLKALEIVNKLGKNEIWFDCACGGGYGTSILSNFTSEIHGYDIHSDAVKYAKKNYEIANVRFYYDFPKNNQYDVIFSLETIEHIKKEDGKQFLSSLLSVLKPEGVLLITTPIVNRTAKNAKNKFHCCEYSLEDLIGLIKCFDNTKIEKIVMDRTVFTDNITKEQGYLKIRKTS